MSRSRKLRYSHTVGFFSLGPGRGFNSPVDVALGPNGLMYVLNRTGPEIGERLEYKRVTICTVDEDYHGEFSSGGTEDGQMMWPASIALDGEGNVFISDEALHRVSIFDSRGNFLGQVGVRGKGDGQFDRPAGLAFDHEGNLLVVDGINGRVQRYTRDGSFLGSWGRPGRADGELNFPWGITVDSKGAVYVADWRNDRVQKFDPDGAHLATWGTSGRGDGQFYRPSWVAVDAEGDVYVTDWGNERLQMLDPDGNFLSVYRGESQLSTWSEDYWRANADEYEERLKANLEPVLEPMPDQYTYVREQSAHVEKLFWGPTSVKIDDRGRVYVVESCRYRVQVYVKEAGDLLSNK